MLHPDVRAILSFLNTCRAHRAHPQRPLVGLAERAARGCFWAGILLFMPPLAIAGWAWAGQELGEATRLVGVVAGIASQLLMLVALCFPIVAGVAALRYWRSDTLLQMLAEFDAEAAYVQALLAYPRTSLQHAHLLLDHKIARNERRITHTFGDKVAVLTLVVMGYSTVQALGGFDSLRVALSAELIQQPLNAALLVGLALLTGLALGSLVLRLLNDRYRYEVELIDQALDQQATTSP